MQIVGERTPETIERLFTERNERLDYQGPGTQEGDRVGHTKHDGTDKGTLQGGPSKGSQVVRAGR